MIERLAEAVTQFTTRLRQVFTSHSSPYLTPRYQGQLARGQFAHGVTRFSSLRSVTTPGFVGLASVMYIPEYVSAHSAPDASTLAMLNHNAADAKALTADLNRLNAALVVAVLAAPAFNTLCEQHRITLEVLYHQPNPTTPAQYT